MWAEPNQLPSCSLGFNLNIKVTLNEGPRSRVQWNRIIPLAESHILDPLSLDEGPRPKSGKLRLPPPPQELEGELMIWRTKVSYRVPTQGFNLLQMSPNWFLSIWTLDPEAKVGPRSSSKLTLWRDTTLRSPIFKWAQLTYVEQM
jgi:hypothetical protein